MKLFITGVHGFLGSYVARHWAAAGHLVSGADLPGATSAAGAVLCRSVPFSLAGEFPAEALLGQDVVLHLAYDRQAGITVNVEGTRRVYHAARAAGVRSQMFMSSYSARPDALSQYGRLKYALETFFLQAGQIVLRPGLVVGDGGMFARNMKTILATPCMPLVDGGRDLLPVIAIEDLMAALTLLLDGRAGAFNLFHPELVTMRRFVETINQMGRHRAIYLPVPSRWAICALTYAGRLRLPVDLDNLRALKQNQNAIHTSDLSSLLPVFRSFDEMIAQAVAAGQKSAA